MNLTASATLRPGARVARWTVRGILALGISCAAAVACAFPAAASLIYGDGDPHLAGCDATAISLKTPQAPKGYLTIKDGSTIAGYAYLRYSVACQSEWVTVTYNSGYYPSPWFWLQNQSGTDLQTSTFAPWQGKVWTDMWDDMHYRAGCGGVQMYHANGIGGQGAYLGWYYLGCASGRSVPTATYTETVGGPTHTWTNYSNAGGTEGATIATGQSVQITCVVQGFKVSDGNTNWYRIASSPWNNAYYASADAFYNNGATSGSLSGTPYVDPKVPSC